MKVEYNEEMLEQEAINKYLNMIANDYGGELARIFKEKYINKDKEIERLNKIRQQVIDKLNTPLAFTSSYQLNYQSAMLLIEEAKSILQGSE